MGKQADAAPARPPRSQSPYAAQPVLLRQARDFRIDRFVDLFGDQAAGVERRNSRAETPRTSRTHGQIKTSVSRRGGRKSLPRRRHVSCPRRGPCAKAAGRSLYRFSSVSARDSGRQIHWFAGRNGNPQIFPAAWCGSPPGLQQLHPGIEQAEFAGFAGVISSVPRRTWCVASVQLEIADMQHGFLMVSAAAGKSTPRQLQRTNRAWGR